MSKVKVSIVSLIALVVFMSVPNESLALTLKCPVNEYGVEECNRSSYGDARYNYIDGTPFLEQEPNVSDAYNLSDSNQQYGGVYFAPLTTLAFSSLLFIPIIVYLAYK